MCIKPKSINKTLKSPLFHFKGNGCFNHKDLFFSPFFFFSLHWVKDLTSIRPMCVWSDSVRGRDTSTERTGREARCAFWSCCWGLRSILTRFHFLSKDETWFYIYSISAAFFKKKIISSVIVSNVPPNSRWDYTYYIISRGLRIIKI